MLAVSTILTLIVGLVLPLPLLAYSICTCLGIGCCNSRRRCKEKRAFLQTKETKADPPGDEAHLEIISLNACLWPPGFRNTKAWPLKDPRCTDIARLLAQADVAVCQEVFSWPLLSTYLPACLFPAGCKWRSLITSAMDGLLAKSYDWSDVDVDACRPYHTFSAGAWTLWRSDHDQHTTNKPTLEQINYEYIPFKHKGFVMFEYVRPVGYQLSSFKVTGSRNTQVLHVINLHLLPSEGAFMDTLPAMESRSLELLQVATSVSRLPPQDAWLIMGDFNMDPKRKIDTKALDNFVAALRKAVQRPGSNDAQLHVFQPHETTLNGQVPYVSAWFNDLGVDHMYSNRQLLNARVLDTNLSDHYPIKASLVL